MTGTIVNSLAIILMGLLGCLVKKALPDTLEKPVMQMIGYSVTLIGLLGFISTAIVIKEGKLTSKGEILLLVSLVLGVLIGEGLKLDDRINAFGAYLENKAGIDGFAKGFITASILFCVGAMAIFGPLQDGISGDSSVLFIKSVIDGITAFILSATLGLGVCFAGVSVFIYQGTIAALASYVAPFMSAVMMDNLCMVGYAIMITLGTNILGVTKIKTVNLIPALIVPVVYTLFL
ncbi:MAG: DUF554 domain-containing protein [Oscillospiraceae bacterium]